MKLKKLVHLNLLELHSNKTANLLVGSRSFQRWRLLHLDWQFHSLPHPSGQESGCHPWQSFQMPINNISQDTFTYVTSTSLSVTTTPSSHHIIPVLQRHPVHFRTHSKNVIYTFSAPSIPAQSPSKPVPSDPLVPFPSLFLLLISAPWIEHLAALPWNPPPDLVNIESHLGSNPNWKTTSSELLTHLFTIYYLYFDIFSCLFLAFALYCRIDLSCVHHLWENVALQNVFLSL